MSVKTHRKTKAAPDSKAGAGKKVRSSAPKTTSQSNGKHPLAAYEHLHIGIVEASLRGKYIDANEEFSRILGYSKKELLRLGIRDCTHEALMNIAKHAHAEHVNLSLRQDEESVCLIIQDDGIAIESWQETDRPGSHGLKIMRERAEAFGGSLRVVSAPGQGTNVEVSVPFKNDGKEQAEKEGQL